MNTLRSTLLSRLIQKFRARSSTSLPLIYLLGNCLLIVLLYLAANTSVISAQKSAITFNDSQFDYTRIIVKFTDHYVVRLRQGKLTSPDGVNLNAVQNLMLSPHIARIERLFTASETDLDAARMMGVQNTGKPLPDLNQYFLIHLQPNTSIPDAKRLIDDLKALSIVQVAYAEPIYQLAGGVDLAPTTSSYVAGQGYLSAAPVGVNAAAAWAQPGGKGVGVTHADVEGGWDYDHEDMNLSSASIIGGTNSSDLGWVNHGSAVLGVVLGLENAYGVTGIAPATTGKMSSIFGQSSSAQAIYTAYTNTVPGDVILIELHAPGPSPTGETCTCNCGQFGYIAMEYWQDIYDVIALATANHRVVVEAAGNGSMNLDHARYGGVFNYNVRDSGAILVGAGTSYGGLAPQCWTNYGSRVDVHGWGDSVTTAGYGDLFAPNGDRRQFYTAQFSGTSSASPVISGSVAALQGIARYHQLYIPPLLMRNLLITTGTSQASSVKHIGPLPNLGQAVPALLDIIDNGTPTPTITPTPASAPSNDHFANAMLITDPLDVTIPYMEAATVQAQEPVHSCPSAGAHVGTNSVWFKVTLGQAFALYLSTEGTVFPNTYMNNDTIMSVYTGNALGSLTEVACNDDMNDTTGASEIYAELSAGTYYVKVSNWGSTPLTQASTLSLFASYDPLGSPTYTPSRTWTVTGTPTKTATGTATPPNTPTKTPSATPSPIHSATGTILFDTPSITPSQTDVPIATATPTFTHTPVSGTELLYNGGMEIGSTSASIPAGWTQKNPTGDKRKCKADYAYAGTCVYQFKSNLGENSQLYQAVIVDLSQGDSLTLSGYVNAKGIVNTQIKVLVTYVGVSEKGKIMVKLNAPTTGWQSLIGMLTLADDATTVKVMLKNKGTTGKVLFDALSLTVSGARLDTLPMPSLP